MKSSWLFQDVEDNLDEGRGGTVPGMFIESCGRQREVEDRVKEGEKGGLE